MGDGDDRESWCGRYLYILYLQSDTKVNADEKKIVKTCWYLQSFSLDAD